MFNEIKKGYTSNQHAKVAVIVAEFNHFITDALLDGCLSTLKYRGNIDSKNITVVKVPGAFEIPLVAKKLAKSGDYHAICALGAVIRGATPHFDYVCGPMASAIMNISLEHELPIAFGVLTTNTIEEAIERGGTKAGNKGSDAAIVALEMLNLCEQISK